MEIADTRIYKRALNEREIHTAYNALQDMEREQWKWWQRLTYWCGVAWLVMVGKVQWGRI